MIGLLILIAPAFVIWRYFSELAHEYDRSRVGFAFIGIGVYFVSQILFGFILGIILAITGTFLELNDIVVDFMGILLGIGSAWLCHYLLKRAWEKQRSQGSGELLDN